MKTNNSSIERVEEFKYLGTTLTFNLLTTTIVAPPSNASKWQIGFNSTFKGLTYQNSVQEEIKSRLKSGNVC